MGAGQDHPMPRRHSSFSAVYAPSCSQPQPSGNQTDRFVVGCQDIAFGSCNASALYWRLALVCRPGPPNYEESLKSWYRERKQQYEKSLNATVLNGGLVTESRWVGTAFRNTLIRMINAAPSWNHWLDLGQRASGLTLYQHESGMPFLP